MSDVVPFKRPLQWNDLRSDQAERLIHERAKDTKNIAIAHHAFDRVEERTILQRDIYRILQTGMVRTKPVQNKKGDWEAVIEKRMPGTRDAGAVVIIFKKDKTLLVKTVMWMDHIR